MIALIKLSLFWLISFPSSKLLGAGAYVGGTGHETIKMGLMHELETILQAKAIDLTLLSDMQKLLYLGGYSGNLVAVEAMLLKLGGLNQEVLPTNYELCLLYDLPAKLAFLKEAVIFFKKLYFKDKLQELLANKVVELGNGERINFSVGLEKDDFVGLLDRIYAYFKDKILNLGYKAAENMAILDQVLAELLQSEGSEEHIEEVVSVSESKPKDDNIKLDLSAGDYIDEELTPEQIKLVCGSDDSEGVEESKSYAKIDENNLVELERFLHDLYDPAIKKNYTLLLATDFDIKKAFYRSIVDA